MKKCYLLFISFLPQRPGCVPEVHEKHPIVLHTHTPDYFVLSSEQFLFLCKDQINHCNLLYLRWKMRVYSDEQFISTVSLLQELKKTQKRELEGETRMLGATDIFKWFVLLVNVFLKKDKLKKMSEQRPASACAHVKQKRCSSLACVISQSCFHLFFPSFPLSS